MNLDEIIAVCEDATPEFMRTYYETATVSWTALPSLARAVKEAMEEVCKLSKLRDYNDWDVGYSRGLQAALGIMQKHLEAANG